MDQRETTTARLERALFPPQDLAAWLGQVLDYPVSDIPTVEDLEREQGRIGLPTRPQSARAGGQEVLDWLAQAVGVANVLRGSAAGRQQELMGKQRGVETFGKEMMDTSRRAYPKKWEEQRAEQWRRPDEPELGLEKGRQSYQEGREGAWRSALPPEEMPQWRRGESFPSDVVQRGEIAAGSRLRPESEVYRLGEMVPLPGGQSVQYVVIPGKWGASVALYDGQHVRLVDSMTSIGEALAKARQLQNRLALAAKDYTRFEERRLSDPDRLFRFPWEQGTSAGPLGPGDDIAPWRYSYRDPPTSGRWSE